MFTRKRPSGFHAHKRGLLNWVRKLFFLNRGAIKYGGYRDCYFINSLSILRYQFFTGGYQTGVSTKVADLMMPFGRENV